MKLKVAIIDHLGAHGSSHHFYLFGQASGLINSDVNVSLYTNSQTIDPLLEGLDFFTFYGDIFSSKNKFISAFKYFKGSLMSHFHARFSGIKVFHYHIFSFSILVLFNMMLAKIIGGKIVLTIHDVRSFANINSSKIYTKFIYALANSVLTHNVFSKNEIIKHHQNLESKISIVPHGNYLPFIKYNTDQFSARKKINIDPNSKVILFFGMIKKVKRLDLLLEAMPEIIKGCDNVNLLIAGKPWKDDFSTYQKIINDLKIHDNCTLHIKFIKSEDLKNYYSASDLIILPYNKIYQSGVLMMSLSFCKAVVLSDLEAFKEVVEDKKSALFFSSGDKNNLAEVIIGALKDNDLREKISEGGLDLMKQKFSWNEIGSLTKDAYYKMNYFYKKK
jgi:glycosyltransferase involved in cell wall biosynthesis